MHSLKNTVVAILLLGVTYGVYESITTPVTETADESLVAPLDIDNGMASAPHPDTGDQAPHTMLPEVAVNPPKSTRLNGASKLTPPVLKATTPPTMGNSIVNRTPQVGFANDKTIDKRASAEFESTKPTDERDQELIDALKDQLDATDEMSDFDPTPKGELTSVAAKPEKEKLTAPRVDTTEPNSFAPMQTQPAPAKAVADVKNPPQTDDLSMLWQQVDDMTQSGQFREALEKLTPYFNDPGLSPVQQQRLLGWLDGLASKVIYSSEHNFDKRPYVVKAGESLIDIADQWEVTPQLIYNVNRAVISDPSNVAEGTRLKQILGPFHGEVDITNKVLTLFVDNLYAGRFPIQVSDQSTIRPGQYGVYRKASQAPEINSDTYMLMLDQGVCIRVASSATTTSPTCIELSAKDATDLFSIFTDKSNFFFKR